MIIFVAASVMLMAQQAPMFTNYSNSYACVNPGFGGLNEGVNVMGIYRNQWTGFKDMDGNAVTAFEANKVYKLRIYLNDNTSSVAVSSFNGTATNPITFYFGAVSYGYEAR